MRTKGKREASLSCQSGGEACSTDSPQPLYTCCPPLLSLNMSLLLSTASISVHYPTSSTHLITTPQPQYMPSLHDLIHASAPQHQDICPPRYNLGISVLFFTDSIHLSLSTASIHPSIIAKPPCAPVLNYTASMRPSSVTKSQKSVRHSRAQYFCSTRSIKTSSTTQPHHKIIVFHSTASIYSSSTPQP
jgi:hypothetical protein